MAEFITDKAAPAEATERDWESLITPEVIKTFDRDGVLLLRQALHPEWLLAIELGLERIMGDSSQAKYKFFDGLPGEFTETIRNFDISPEAADADLLLSNRRYHWENHSFEKPLVLHG